MAGESGRSTNETRIVIDLRDDVQVENVETIRVSLRSGQGYQVGVQDRHVVSIHDNDLNWRIMHDVDGMRFDYGIQFFRTGNNTTATAWSDGPSGLPAGTFPAKLSVADDRFEAIVGPITTVADRTLLGAELSRTFRLVANRPEDGSRIDYGQPPVRFRHRDVDLARGCRLPSATQRDSRGVPDVAIGCRPGSARYPAWEKTFGETTSPSGMVDLASACAIDDLWTTGGFSVKAERRAGVSRHVAG